MPENDNTTRLRELLQLTSPEKSEVPEKSKKRAPRPPAEAKPKNLAAFTIRQHGPVPFDLSNPPTPFVPPSDIGLEPDPADRLLPAEGSFISDFAYSMKGAESPMIFNIWAALYTISVMSARRSYFKWKIGGALYPNLYVIVVAPPAICHKGAAFGRSARLLKHLPRTYINDPFMREEKTIKMFSSKATPEAITMMLKPKKTTFLTPDGTTMTENYGSRMFGWVDELATFMNIRKYNAGLVDTLNHLYDCPEDDSEFTRAREEEKIENAFFCFAGACTPSHLWRSIPQEAFEGGFMSRCILIYQEAPIQLWPEPEELPGFPTEDDLLRRLHWLSYKVRGAYYFAPDARDYYHTWYRAYQGDLIAKGVHDRDFGRLRHTQLVIRVATLLRMAEYREGFDVSLQNILDARTILEYVMAFTPRATELVGANDSKKSYVKVRNYIQHKVDVGRKQLLQRFSADGILQDEINRILIQLKQENCVKFVLDGNERTSMEPASQTREHYVWIGNSHSADEEALEA